MLSQQIVVVLNFDLVSVVFHSFLCWSFDVLEPASLREFMRSK